MLFCTIPYHTETTATSDQTRPTQNGPFSFTRCHRSRTTRTIKQEKRTKTRQNRFSKHPHTLYSQKYNTLLSKQQNTPSFPSHPSHPTQPNSLLSVLRRFCGWVRRIPNELFRSRSIRNLLCGRGSGRHLGLWCISSRRGSFRRNAHTHRVRHVRHRLRHNNLDGNAKP